MTDYQIVVLYNMLMDRILYNFKSSFRRGGHRKINIEILAHNTVCKRCEYIVRTLEWLPGEYRSFRYPDFKKLEYTLIRDTVSFEELLRDNHRIVPAYSSVFDGDLMCVVRV